MFQEIHLMHANVGVNEQVSGGVRWQELGIQQCHRISTTAVGACFRSARDIVTKIMFGDHLHHVAFSGLFHKAFVLEHVDEESINDLVREWMLILCRLLLSEYKRTMIMNIMWSLRMCCVF
jgi:hypothetical protein